MKTKEQLIVIGNGMSGIATIEHLLSKGHNFDITIFGSEPHVNYNRVLLSSVLSCEQEFEEIILNPPEWYKNNNINLHLGVTINSLDVNNKEVITDDGKRYQFDKLLIATGSSPFIPPIKGARTSGILTPGIFTFRNLEDTMSMIQWAHGSRKALIIGGGLLGIEAASGLINQGLDVTIAHLVERLMEMQLDDTGADILKREITRRGIRVLLGYGAEEIIIDNGRVGGIRFSNGRVHEADMIVIATGIRPNVHLAKEAGFTVNNGIVVNDYLQTSHPDIYAVGECAEHRGKVYGIVAPLMEQAKVAAEVISGNCNISYKGSIIATRLKVAGIPLASMGSYQGDVGCEEITYCDQGSSVYKKLVISGGRMVGAILLGDIDGYNRYLGLIRNQGDISLQRKTLMSGQPQAMTSVASMPDDATICGCMGVSKGSIINAIEEYNLTSVKEISEKTKACTSCKGCKPLIEQLLQEVLGGEYVKQDKPREFCECIPMRWEDIRTSVIAHRLRSVSDILLTLGNGPGCQNCKPGLNYMLSELYLDDYEREVDALLENDRHHANIQKDGTFSVVPRIYGGVTTSDQLRRIADVADKYNVPMLKITGGQRIDLLGISGEKLSSVWEDLGMPSGHAYTKAVRTSKTCIGNSFCRYGLQNSIGLGILMEQRYQGIPCPGKIKLGVSGCPRNCVETWTKDIGVIGIHTGWEIYVGGNGGVKPRVGELLEVVKTEDEVIDITDIFLQYYRENAQWMERTSHFTERVGIDHIREVILEDKLGIAGRLKKRIEEVAASYKDPWLERSGILPDC